MWTIALTLLKKPTVIAIILLTIACSGLYINNTIQDGKIAKLEANVIKIETNFNTCKSNEHDLLAAIAECNGAADSWITSNEAIRVQLKESQIQVRYWQDLYDNKMCFNNEDETPVVPSQGKVVKDEKSIDAVNRLNNIFGN